MAKIDAVVTQFESLNGEITAVIEACTEEQWQTIVPEEERSAAVMFHHIVSAYPFAAGLAMELVAKKKLPPVTMEKIHDQNKQHADQFEQVTKEEVLRTQRENVAQTVKQINTITNQQMDIAAPFALMNGRPISVHDLLSYLLIGHGKAHFEAVKATIS